jgi:hypothetical protein
MVPGEEPPTAGRKSEINMGKNTTCGRKIRN